MLDQRRRRWADVVQMCFFRSAMPKRCFFAPSCKGGGGGWRVCHLVRIQTIIKRSKDRNDHCQLELDKLVEVERDGATIDYHKSCVSTYVSVTRRSSQGKKRRSSSASDTPSHIHVYMEKTLFTVWRGVQRTRPKT